jgi:hypothetical protein
MDSSVRLGRYLDAFEPEGGGATLEASLRGRQRASPSSVAAGLALTGALPSFAQQWRPGYANRENQ